MNNYKNDPTAGAIVDKAIAEDKKAAELAALRERVAEYEDHEVTRAELDAMKARVDNMENALTARAEAAEARCKAALGELSSVEMDTLNTTSALADSVIGALAILRGEQIE